MASISSMGVGSGLDAESIVKQLMALERKSLTSLQTKIQGVETQISAFGSIKSLVDNFAASAGKFKTLNGFAAFKATSADSTKLGATASVTATAGSYDVVVKKLAQAAKTAVSIPNATAATQIGAGKLNIQVGTDPAKAVDVEVNSATATLGDWRDAINRSNAGVTATIVYGATAAELVFTAKETGKPITISTGATIDTQEVPGTPTALSGTFSTTAAVPYQASVSGQPQVSTTPILSRTTTPTALSGVFTTTPAAPPANEKQSVILPPGTTTATIIGAGKVGVSLNGGPEVGVTLGANATLQDWRNAFDAAGVQADYDPVTHELSLMSKTSGQTISINNSIDEITDGTVILGSGTLTIAGTTISAGQENATLGQWIQAINAANIGVTASHDGTNLVLTGSQNGQVFSINDNLGPSGFERGFDTVATIADQAEQLAVNEKKSLTLAPGTTNATLIGAGKIGVSLNGDPEIEVPLGANATLQQWRDALDAAGVKADYDPVTRELSLLNKTQGHTISLNNSIATVDATYTGSGAPALLSGTYTVKQAGQLAEMTIDGVTVTSESNTVTTAIPGMTLNLLKTTDPDPINVTVARDTSATVDALTKFVSDFNALNSKIKSLTAYDSTNKKANTLTGDATVRSMQTLLTDVFNSALIPADPSNNKKLLNMPSIGITFQRDGNLALDSSKLQELMTSDFEGVANVLATYSTKLTEKTTAMTQTGGMFASKTESLKLMIKDFGKREDSLNLRLEAIEKRYRAQFSGLDTLVASMQQTSTFLTQQIARLG